MSGNVLKRNIICYREPQAKLFNLKNADLRRGTRPTTTSSGTTGSRC